MTTTSPVVSVVTPVYNGQEYLEECIQSVLRQTYSDWEFVICDNLSTDTSLAIAERFAALDPRIRVERGTEFLGALDNHNRAMRAMDPRTRYCKVLHADDWLYPECLDRMVALAERNPSVGMVSSFRLVRDHVEHASPFPYSESVMSGPEVVRWELLWSKGWVTGSPTSLLLRSDLVRERADFYDRTVWHSDTDAAYRVLMQSDFGFVHQVLTYTRRHTGALNTFSARVWSFITRDGRLLMRYGPRLLSPPAYRARLRRWLWHYGHWLARRLLKQIPHPQKEFLDFHRREIDYLLLEAGQDHETRRVLLAYRRLLGGSDRQDSPAPAGPQNPSA